MTKLTFDIAQQVIDAQIRIESIEEAGDAVAAIKGAARVLWPNILFPGDKGFDGDEQPDGVGGGRRKWQWRDDWRPKPGSVAERILPDALAGKSAVEIADAYDLTTQTVGIALARLRRAGLLTPKDAAEGA